MVGLKNVASEVSHGSGDGLVWRRFKARAVLFGPGNQHLQQGIFLLQHGQRGGNVLKGSGKRW